VFDWWKAEGSERLADRANHNPPAASSTASAANRYFLFIVFFFKFAPTILHDF